MVCVRHGAQHSRLRPPVHRRLVPRAVMLQIWHAAIASIPASEVTPIGLGGVSNDANLKAFYGDKLLGAALAQAQWSNSKHRSDLGLLTAVHSAAASNHLLSEKLSEILPVQASDKLLERAAYQSHDAGTMVEATVAVVSLRGNQAAVADLARWLVKVCAPSRILPIQSYQPAASVSSERCGGFLGIDRWPQRRGLRRGSTPRGRCSPQAGLSMCMRCKLTKSQVT